MSPGAKTNVSRSGLKKETRTERRWWGTSEAGLFERGRNKAISFNLFLPGHKTDSKKHR